MKPGPADVRHLYVHAPFCRSRCAYCDFASEPVGPHLRSGRVAAYIERLEQELMHRLGREVEGAGLPPAVETVYLGGGTPTILPEELLLDLVARLTRLQEGAVDPEFTIEANPGTIDAGLLARLGDAGVTRVSLGVQSFSSGLRAALGRHTTREEVTATLRDLAEAAASGLRPLEWNLDLVFGIPGQTWEAAAADIDAAMAAGPSHISLYDLTYTAEYEARVARAAGPQARAAAVGFAEEYLPAAAARLQVGGYLRYEVSNFALSGHECRHNLGYWRGEDYLGVGASAVSTIGGERITNPRTVEGYLAGEAPGIEALDARTRLWEKAMLGLRTIEGVDEEEVLPVLDRAALERLEAQECVERRCGRLRLNPAFLDVSNTVIASLLAPPESPPEESEPMR